MKTIKRLAALLLTLCILAGVPVSVSAVGSAAPTQMKLVGAMPITSDIRVGSALHTNSSWGDKGLMVFFNQPVPINIGSTRCYIVVVDANNQVVNYNGTNLIWTTNRSTAELWQIRGNFLAMNNTITIGGKAVNTWTSLAEVLTTDAALANKGYRLQLRMMGVSGETTNNGYVDTVINNGQKLASNLKVVSNSSPINGGSTDCYYVEIGTAVAAAGTQKAYIKPCQIVTLDQVAMVDQTRMTLTFSEAVTIDTARNDAVLEIVSADGKSVAKSYAVTLTAGHAAAVSASLTTATWTQIVEDLAGAASGSYVRFKMTEKNVNTAWGENQFNFVVDTVWGKDTFRPLRSNTGAAAQYAHDFVLCNVQSPVNNEPLTLEKAQPLTIDGKDYVVLSFSHPVSWNASSLGACISLNVINQNGVVISQNGSLCDRALVRDSLRYYGASGKQVILPLRNNGNEVGFANKTTIADIRAWVGALGTNRMVARIIDQTGNNGNGTVDCFWRTDDPTVKLTRNHVSGSEEWGLVDLEETAVDSIAIEAVHVYKQRNLIVTFDRPVVAQPNLYSAIRLVDENNTLYWANTNNGGAASYTAGRTNATTSPLQWQISAVTLNNTGASQYGTYGTSGRQLIGTLGIDYDKIVQIEQEAEAWFAAQGTPKDLRLRLCLEEKNVSSQYGTVASSNYVVDSVYAADGSSCLPASKGNANGHYFDLTDVENASLTSAYAVDDYAIEFVFSAPVRTDVYSTNKSVNVKLNVIKSDGSVYKFDQGYAPEFYGTLTPVDASYNDQTKGYTQYRLTDVHRTAWTNQDTRVNVKDLLAAMNAAEGQLAGCSLRLTLSQNIDHGDIAGWIDNITDADGVCRLRANNGDNACAVTVDPTSVDSEAVTVKKWEILGENKLKITFSEAVSSTSSLSALIRVTDADGYMMAYANGTYNRNASGGAVWLQASGALVPMEGTSDDEWVLTLTWMSNSFKALGGSFSYSRMYEVWEKNWKDLGYKLVFCLETDPITSNGLMDAVSSTATGRKLVCGGLLKSVAGDRSGWNDFVHKDITTCDFFKTGNPQVTAIKQYSTNQVLVSFDQPVKLNGSVTPWTSMRLINANGVLLWLNVATNNTVSTSSTATYADGRTQYWNTVTKSGTDDPICKDADGNVQFDGNGNPIQNPVRQNIAMQWGASGLTVLNDGTDILFTFAENVDVAALVNMDNLLEFMKKEGYSMQLVIEEKDPGDGTFTTEDSLVANIVNDNNRQLIANRKTGNNAYYGKVELIDPDAPVTVTSVKITGETEITFTFSEAVNLGSNMNMALLRYVDKDSYRLFQTKNGYVQWNGILSYANDTKTQIKWTLRSGNPANKNLIANNLAQIVQMLQTKEDLKSLNGVLTLCLEETGTNKTAGFIDSFRAVSGKSIEAQPYIPGWADGVYMPIDLSQVIRGELSVVSATAVADNELVVTFSAPVAIETDPWYCVRLFDAKNNLIFDGKTPMQWGLTPVSLSADGRQLRLALASSNALPVHNLTDILAYDWSEYAEGAHIRFYIEEKDAPMVLRNSHVDNIALASDARIHLDATDFNERDGFGTAITVDYPNIALTTKATVINESQLRITFSHPIEIKGDVYMALCYVDDDHNLLSHLGLNKSYPQWGGNWEWENESKTSILWTMNAGMYGCKTIADVVNQTGMLADLYPDANILFRIEEKSNDACQSVGWTGLVDNVSTANGRVHLPATGSGMDRHFTALYNTQALIGDEVELLSVKATDNKTIELTFSEAVAVKEGEQAPIMAIRYLSASGDTEVGIDGRTLSFTGYWKYKDENKNVIVWTLDTEKAAKRGAQSMDDIFTFAGDFRWNKGARIAFVIVDEEENALVGSAMRVIGITDLSGYRNLVSNRGGDIAQVQMDIEIGYDLPVTVETVEETVYVTNYLPYGIAGGAVAVIGIAIAVILGVKRKKED